MSNFNAQTLVTRGNQTVGYWNKNVGYSLAEAVFYQGALFVSIINNNVNNIPPDSMSAWSLLQGVGINNQGFADYRDASTNPALGGTPLNISANTWTPLVSDGVGFINEEPLPFGVNHLWDVDNNHIDVTDMTQYSQFDIRADFAITPTLDNTLAKFRLRFTDENDTNLFDPIQKRLARLDEGTISYPLVESFGGYYGTTDIKKIYVDIFSTSDATIIMQGFLIVASIAR